MDILRRLDLYRLENRITQEDLAKQLGVSFSTVSRWLNGKTKPRKTQEYHIQKFLKKRVR
jgi:transcriptional regulator with XRE-family HTH domain